MTQLYFRNVLRLNLVYPESYHQIRNYLGFLVGFANQLYRVVDIHQYLLQTVQQMEFLLLLL